MRPTAPEHARRLGVCALSAALFVQTTPADPAGGDSAAGPYPRSSVTVGASGSGGRYGMTCGGVRGYRVGGVAARYTRERSRHSALGVEARAFGGHDRGVSDTTPRLPIRGAALIAHYERRNYGVAYGYAAGRVVTDGESSGGSPISRARLGPRRLHLYVDAGYEEPLGFPRPGLQVGAAAALPRALGRVRLGVGQDGAAGGLALALPGGLEVEPFGVYGERIDAASDGGRGPRAFHFSVAARKRFELRTRRD